MGKDGRSQRGTGRRLAAPFVTAEREAAMDRRDSRARGPGNGGVTAGSWRELCPTKPAGPPLRRPEAKLALQGETTL